MTGKKNKIENMLPDNIPCIFTIRLPLKYNDKGKMTSPNTM